MPLYESRFSCIPFDGSVLFISVLGISLTDSLSLSIILATHTSASRRRPCHATKSLSTDLTYAAEHADNGPVYRPDSDAITQRPAQLRGLDLNSAEKPLDSHGS
jgi:hypothetical protein